MHKRARLPYFLISIAAAAAWSLPAAAFLTTVRDAPSSFGYPEGSSLAGVPDFAFSRARTEIRESPYPNDVTAVTGCSRLITPFCSQVGAPVEYAPDLSAEGVEISVVARGGADTTSTELRASSTGSSVPLSGYGNRQVIVDAIDWQVLRFEVPTAVAPPGLLVDMTYSIFAALTDASSLSSADAGYSAVTTGALGVYEVATVNDPQGIYTPFAQGATVTSFSGAPVASDMEMIDNAVETLTLKPNTDYWLILNSTASLRLISESLNPALIDFDGLDVSMTASADPVFSLNPAFAADNPDVAAALTVSRVSAVPVPAALPLLASALAGWGFAGWSRRG